MQKQLVFHDKSIDISISNKAITQSNHLHASLIIEIQIYFSCLLGKRLAFYSDHSMNGVWQVDSEQFSSMLNESQQLTDNVYLRFNTVMTKACSVSDYAGPPPVTDFTIKNQTPYVPSWLSIDFIEGQWTGEFGWPSSNKSYGNTKQVRAQAKRAQ